MRNLLHFLYAELACTCSKRCNFGIKSCFFLRVLQTVTVPLRNSPSVHCSLSCTHILELSHPQGLAGDSAQKLAVLTEDLCGFSQSLYLISEEFGHDRFPSDSFPFLVHPNFNALNFCQNR